MSTMPTSPLVRAAAPRGFPDREGADIAAAEAMMSKIREVYSLYGFEAVETPFVEHTEALGKFLPDLDRPNEGVFSFKDDDEQWLSLRYDLTAPLARYFAENYEKLPKPYRSYRAGWVFRNEKPGPGRFRQFMQFDADTVGSASPAADAEMCMMAADCLEALGVKRGEYVIKVNNRKVLDGVMEAIGLGGADNAGRRLVVLRAIDKLDRLGPEGVRALLGEGRKDESGDFTRGAGLDPAAIDRVIAYTQARADDNASTLDALGSAIANTAPGAAGVAELCEIAALASASGYGEDRVIVDPAVVRGLEYYTGPVFEAELNFEVKDEAGRPVRFGSVGGGGRYDGLVARFRSEPVPATGFSIGVSRAAGGVARHEQPDRRRGGQARSGRRARARPRPHGGLSAPRRHAARRGDCVRALSRRRRHERPAEIRGPAALALRRDSGFQRTGRAGGPAGGRSRSRARRRTRQGEQGSLGLSRDAPARADRRAGSRTRDAGSRSARARRRALAGAVSGGRLFSPPRSAGRGRGWGSRL